MIIRRVHKRNFTIVPNKVFVDDSLSLDAKGLLGYLLSRPNNWHVHLNVVAKVLGVGRGKGQRLFNELIEARYVTRLRQPRLRGQRFGTVEYLVYDEQVARPTTGTSRHRRLKTDARLPRVQNEPTVNDRESMSCAGITADLTADPPRAQNGTVYKNRKLKSRRQKQGSIIPQFKAIPRVEGLTAEQKRRHAAEHAVVKMLGGWAAAAEFDHEQVAEFVEHKLNGTLTKSAIEDVLIRRAAANS